MRTQRRRERGSLNKPRLRSFNLEEHVDKEIGHLAAELDVPRSVILQWMVENFPRREDGVPVGWDATAPATLQRNDDTLPGMDRQGAA